MTTHCTGCGAPSDPKKAVCPYCETPYPEAKPKKPKKRRTITGNHARHETLEDVTLMGNHNRVDRAEECQVTGNHNRVKGADQATQVTGNHNTVRYTGE